MTTAEFRSSLGASEPPAGLSIPLQSLWWDAKGEWTRAHDLVNEMETKAAMAVHAYLHRKEGSDWNADYWYRRAGRDSHRPVLADEWQALVECLCG